MSYGRVCLCCLLSCGAHDAIIAPRAQPTATVIDAGAPKRAWHPRQGPSIEQLLAVHRADGPALNADGSVVAFLSDAPGVLQPYLAQTSGTQAERAWTRMLPAETERVREVRIPPRSHFYFFSRDKGGDENFQILRSSDGTSAIDLTNKPKVRHELGAFTEDGQTFSFTSTERDGKDFDVYVEKTSGGAPVRIFDADGSYAPVAFSPDGARLVAQRERSSFDHELVMLDARAAAKQQKPWTIVPRAGALEGIARFEHARFSKDGKSLFVVSDLGRDWMSVARVDLASKKMEIILPEEHDVDLMEVRGETMAIAVNVDGYSEVRLYDVRDPSKPAKKVDVALPKGVVTALALSGDASKLAVAQSGPTFPNEIFLVDTKTGVGSRLTESDHAGVREADLVTPTLEHVKARDGVDVPVFVYRPHDLAPDERAPAIVSVHGGPEAQFQPMFNAVIQFLVGRGYVVAAPNIRGSTGYGKAFAHLDDKEKREDSIADLAAVNAWLRARPEIDGAHIAIMGGSYGGYATLASVTLYPELWAAACDIVGIANFTTFLEKTAPYRRALREAEYGALDKDAALLERISPIHKVDKIRSPLFVIHGANDPRVPVEEAEQIVGALQKRGVRVEYMRFDDEGHGLLKRPNRVRAYGALATFFDQVL